MVRNNSPLTLPTALKLIIQNWFHQDYSCTILFTLTTTTPNLKFNQPQAYDVINFYKSRKSVIFSPIIIMYWEKSQENLSNVLRNNVIHNVLNTVYAFEIIVVTNRVIWLIREHCLFLIDTCNIFIDTSEFLTMGVYIPLPIHYASKLVRHISTCII